MNTYIVPERMVRAAGVGMEHDELVRLANQYFVDTEPSWDTQVIQKMGGRIDQSISQYTGGMKKVVLYQGGLRAGVTTINFPLNHVRYRHLKIGYLCAHMDLPCRYLKQTIQFCLTA